MLHSDELRSRLRSLVPLFLKLGSTGFGGPQANIALMNEALVVQRRWITPEAFTEGMALCEMLPGPASTQMGIYSGYLRAGYWGAWVAGICFIAPAWLIVVALSWGYFQFQAVPQVDAVLLGVSPVVVAIILSFCWKLGRETLGRWSQGAIAILTFLTTILTSLPILFQFLMAGTVGLVLYRARTGARVPLLVPCASNTSLLLAGLPASQTAETLAMSAFFDLERIGDFGWPLGLFFLKVGSFIFGGGLVIIPLLESEVVQQLHWLSPQEFVNGVAIGQLSPGPVVLTAAFIGYKVAGVLGALVASIAIFAPSFAFVMLAAPLMERLRQSLWLQAFLQGVTPAVLGAIAGASLSLLAAALRLEFTWEPTWEFAWEPALPRLTLGVASWPQTALAFVVLLGALVALLHFKRPPWQVILAGALLGLGLGRWLGL